MRQFELTDEFRDEFRVGARRYLARVEAARRRIADVERARSTSKDARNDWRVALAEALRDRDVERVQRAEGRVVRLIRSLTGGTAEPDMMIADDPIEPIAGFPAVEACGHVFALIGEDQGFVVRPSWSQVRLDE